MNFTNECIGKKISCIINETIIPEARIQKEKNFYYICQNFKNGKSCKDRFGFSYSWGVYNGSEENISSNAVTNIIFLSETPFLEKHPSETKLLSINQFLKINQNE